MKSIGADLANKLELQAKEAQFLKKEILADDIDIQLKNHKIRMASEEDYTYPRKQYEEDIRDGFLAMALRTMDFYGKSCNDIGILQLKLKKFAEQLEQEVCIASNTECTKVGAYEPALPGEIKKTSSKNKPDYDFEVTG